MRETEKCVSATPCRRNNPFFDFIPRATPATSFRLQLHGFFFITRCFSTLLFPDDPPSHQTDSRVGTRDPFTISLIALPEASSSFWSQNPRTLPDGRSLLAACSLLTQSFTPLSLFSTLVITRFHHLLRTTFSLGYIVIGFSTKSATFHKFSDVFFVPDHFYRARDTIIKNLIQFFVHFVNFPVFSVRKILKKKYMIFVFQNDGEFRVLFFVVFVVSEKSSFSNIFSPPYAPLNFPSIFLNFFIKIEEK